MFLIWYMCVEMVKCVMFFYFGNQFGQVFFKLLVYGIFYMGGVGGKVGWFWLFVFMGGFIIFCGFVFGFCFFDLFCNFCLVFLLGMSFFIKREFYIFQICVFFDELVKGKKKKFIKIDVFKRVFFNWCFWFYVIIIFCNNGF